MTPQKATWMPPWREGSREEILHGKRPLSLAILCFASDEEGSDRRAAAVCRQKKQEKAAFRVIWDSQPARTVNVDPSSANWIQT